MSLLQTLMIPVRRIPVPTTAAVAAVMNQAQVMIPVPLRVMIRGQVQAPIQDLATAAARISAAAVRIPVGNFFFYALQAINRQMNGWRQSEGTRKR